MEQQRLLDGVLGQNARVEVDAALEEELVAHRQLHVLALRYAVRHVLLHEETLLCGTVSDIGTRMRADE